VRYARRVSYSPGTLVCGTLCIGMLSLCLLAGCQRLMSKLPGDLSKGEDWDEQEAEPEEDGERRGPLRPGVYVLSPRQMKEYCETDPAAKCAPYDDVPDDVILEFEEKLPTLLGNYGYADVVPKLNQYVRQYWGVGKEANDSLDPRLTVFGNFVCKSLVERELGLAAKQGTKTTQDQLLEAPFIVDVMGKCRITATFSADDTNEVGFWEDTK
jgi:hypothetical protein